MVLVHTDHTEGNLTDLLTGDPGTDLPLAICPFANSSTADGGLGCVKLEEARVKDWIHNVTSPRKVHHHVGQEGRHNVGQQVHRHVGQDPVTQIENYRLMRMQHRISALQYLGCSIVF